MTFETKVVDLILLTCTFSFMACGSEQAATTTEQAAAAAVRGNVQQRQIVTELRGGQAVPLQAQRRQAAEECICVGPVGDEVEIHEDGPPRAVRPDLLHHLGDRSL